MNDPISIFFFGDSICIGQGVSIDQGWVTRISAHLNELAHGHNRNVIVINASVNGNTTRQALERMPYDIQSHRVDLIIIQFGMNDCNYWKTDRGNPRVSPNAFGANLEEIINRGLTFGANRVFLNTNHPTLRDAEKMPYTDVTYQESNERYNEIIRSVASLYDSRVFLNDIEMLFRSHIANGTERLLDLLLPDLLHLSVKGHDLYFNAVYPVIKDAALNLIANKTREQL